MSLRVLSVRAKYWRTEFRPPVSRQNSVHVVIINGIHPQCVPASPMPHNFLGGAKALLREVPRAR